MTTDTGRSYISNGACLLGVFALVSAAVCGLGVIGAGLAYSVVLASRSRAAAGSPSATPVGFVDFSATGLAHLDATATALAPTLTARASWSAEINDAFKHNGLGWPIGREDDDWSQISRSIDEGLYRWSVQTKTDKGASVWGFPQAGEGADFYSAVDERQLSGAAEWTSFGIVFGASDDGQTYSTFQVSDTGKYSIATHRNGRVSSPINWSDTPWVEAGRFHHLSLSVHDNVLLALIDDHLVGHVEGFQTPVGWIGLVVTVDGPQGSTAAFEFDNFIVRRP